MNTHTNRLKGRFQDFARRAADRIFGRHTPPPAAPAVERDENASSFYKVNFEREATAASVRRAMLNRNRQVVAMNGRGLPAGHRYIATTTRELRRLEKRGELIPKPGTKGEFYFGALHERAIEFHAAAERTAQLRPARIERIARRVSRNLPACSAMRWMISKLEEQEREGRGTERAGIRPAAYGVRTEVLTADMTRQQRRAATRSAMNNRLAITHPNEPRKLRRGAVRGYLSGVPAEALAA
jgi:hypothetical protein